MARSGESTLVGSLRRRRFFTILPVDDTRSDGLTAPRHDAAAHVPRLTSAEPVAASNNSNLKLNNTTQSQYGLRLRARIHARQPDEESSARRKRHCEAALPPLGHDRGLLHRSMPRG